uniref:FAS1 domain-containing protein n=1 Tax=Opuntia streptacantha TaxID=393608 RepID=A0A7C8ZYQ6_OPUST
MASSLPLTLFLLASIATQCLAQSPKTAAPAPAPKINLTAILEKGGQFTTFMKLLASTQVGSQVENQVKSSSEGMTIFAPTDNAFQNLKAGTINSLSAEKQVQLVLNHVLPKFYTMDNLETVSNPVRTQASGQDGGNLGLNITSMGNNQVNVSCGPVQTQINNVLRKDFPLAVYQVDKVLLLPQNSTSKAKAPAPLISPVSSTPAKTKGSDAKDEGPVADEKNGGFGVRSMGLGLVFGFALATFGFLS